MKKFFIGILFFPILIFVVGLVFIFAGKGLNFISPAKQDIKKSEDNVIPAVKKDEVKTAAPLMPKPISKLNIKYLADKYYNVAGSTRDEIRSSMVQAKKGTFLEGHDAATTVETNIKFTRRQLADKCEAAMTQFNLIFTYTYPKWVPPKNAAPDLVAKWGAFLAALKVHEEGHTKIEIERANTLMRELQTMPSRSTCEDFDSAWQAKANAFDLETKEIEARYDSDTQSGKSQNVIF